MLQNSYQIFDYCFQHTRTPPPLLKLCPNREILLWGRGPAARRHRKFRGGDGRSRTCGSVAREGAWGALIIVRAP